MERAAFQQVREELNAGFGDGLDIKFEPLGWEDTLASTGRRSQAVINREIDDRCDEFILACTGGGGRRLRTLSRTRRTRKQSFTARVRTILKEEGLKVGPDKTSDCWDNFIKRHTETLWAVDFFSIKTVTATGLRDMYLMAFLCLSSREVIVSSSTEHPNSAWVVEQTKEFLDQTMTREQKPAIVMHDRDTKFTKEFTATLKAKGVRTNVLPVASPNLDGRVERFIQTIKYECLFKFILFGKRHLDHVVAEFVDYYNGKRAHMERDHLPPIRKAP